MAQPQFWGQFGAMDRKGKASGAGGAQSARTPRFLAMRYRQRHSIDDESLLSGASTSSEDGSAEGDAEGEERVRSGSLRWDVTGEEFKLVHGTRARRELYQRQQIPILEGEPHAADHASSVGHSRACRA